MNAIETRITEVATWILKVNPHFEHNYFRSPEIQPFHKKPSVQRVPISSLANFSLEVEKRRMLLKEKEISLISLDEALTLGSLVYTRPIDSTLDGGAEFYSQCLLDIWEVPAWDTWVTCDAEEFPDFIAYHNCLIAWIPASVHDLFYSGFAVCLENNMGWVKLVPKNSALTGRIGEPANLKFIEGFDQKELEGVRNWG
ncbi:hypothetical protein GCM10027422_20540 [Hymenobacter arcticus]